MSSLRSFEDFEPSSEWVHEEAFGTLLIHLPGFKRNQIKVQITNSNQIKISGERPLDDQHWSRFVKQVPLPQHCKAAETRAKFENGVLHVRIPIAQVAPSTTIHKSPTSLPMEKAATELREKTEEGGDGKRRKAVPEGEFLPKEQKQPAEAKEDVIGQKEQPKENPELEGRSNSEDKQGQQTSPALQTDDTSSQEKETKRLESISFPGSSSKGGEMMARYSINNLLMELTLAKKILLASVAISSLVLVGIGLYFMYKQEDE
ncbi:inactive protein RESTRICTED TEV MOVEMENT 2-like [Zingiber officinale]|uniref:SHSP domain-containing protein n=1 Tax=Zingiber officinale TaxID=94328 RepID=A0A8J5HS53_ZINOF|nr:inactive protein RESTRICTED TEV MOVEMENT 2-like [Zingiber officinale]KAG6534168.1 hypothetical protein ZIOFF_008053 [Zingiber officinale]